MPSPIRVSIGCHVLCSSPNPSQRTRYLTIELLPGPNRRLLMICSILYRGVTGRRRDVDYTLGGTTADDAGDGRQRRTDDRGRRTTEDDGRQRTTDDGGRRTTEDDGGRRTTEDDRRQRTTEDDGRRTTAPQLRWVQHWGSGTRGRENGVAG